MLPGWKTSPSGKPVRAGDRQRLRGIYLFLLGDTADGELLGVRLPESLRRRDVSLGNRPELWRGIHPECSRSCSGEGIFGLPNYRFEESAQEEKGVVVRRCAVEMSEVQIRYYARKISELLSNEGVFFELKYDTVS